MKNLLFIFGTRPEAIKLAPLIIEFRKHPELFITKVCITAQHRQMLDQVLDFFKITPDEDLDLMKNNQTLFDTTGHALLRLQSTLKRFSPDLVFVQGDTTTTFIGSLAAFYAGIKIAHVEAGLRSRDKWSPYPEEVNRILTSHLADFHFAPTEKARENLMNEGITEKIFVVTNTVIDALHLALQIIQKNGEDGYRRFFNFLDFSKKIVLVTGHRRESFGKPFENICKALLDIARAEPDVQLVYPVHLNPNVHEPVHRLLARQKNIYLIEPLDYPYLIWLLSRSYLVLTDSGGIQEEAPSLGIPVLVMRDVTERIEGIKANTAKLVGTGRVQIADEAQNLLYYKSRYAAMSHSRNPYGDGKASRRIVDIIGQEL